MKPRPLHHRSDLREIARRVMRERGLLSEFEPAVVEQLRTIVGPAHDPGTSIRDMTDLSWASIDNDDSLDLDQLTAAREEPKGVVTTFVAVADVDAVVREGTPIDGHARHNTTSVYTGAEIFPMLPEKLPPRPRNPD